MTGLGLLLLVMGGAAAPAAPRLTLRLERATFHETLQRLQVFYGWQISATDDAGREGYQAPPNSRRAGFEWKEATVGTVFRDVARAYGETPRMTGADSVLFQPGPLPAVGLAVTREGVEITLRRVEQSERRTQAIGTGSPETTRTVALSMTLRPLEGDPEALFGLDRLRARDDTGTELQPDSPDLQRGFPADPGSLPDEWPVTVRFRGGGARARRLEWVEGEVVLYRAARTYRVELPLPLTNPAQEWSAGAARLLSVSVEKSGNGLLGSYVAAWPRGVVLTASTGKPPGFLQPSARLRSGVLARLSTTFSGVSVDERGEQSARMELAPQALPEEPVALVWDLVVKADPERRIPFRLSQVPLPLAPAESARNPGPGLRNAAPPARATKGSVLLQVLPLQGPRAGELAVGLARKRGGAWGPVRWTTLETDERGGAQLDGVEPGVYQIHLSFRPRDARGNLGPETPLVIPGSPTITVAAGKTARAPAAR
jgi:hypothetical protein